MKYFRKTFLTLTLASLGLVTAATTATAEPTKIRVGHGSAAEEQLWLMHAMPELSSDRDVYDIELSHFRGTDKRFQAFQGGALDIATASANSVLFAASEGVDMQIIASLSRESERGFFTQYMVMEDSGINSIEDLKGKTIGINGFRSSMHMWAIKALEDAGLDPDSDVVFTPVRFPAQGEALRAGIIDLASFPQPFYHIEEEKGNVRTLFTSKDSVPFEEELMLLLARPEFVEQNEEVVRSFLSDLVATTDYYLNNPAEARTALVESGISRSPIEAYIAMEDYYRDPEAKVNIESLEKMQEMQIEMGWQRNRVDIPSIVNNELLPE